MDTPPSPPSEASTQKTDSESSSDEFCDCSECCAADSDLEYDLKTLEISDDLLYNILNFLHRKKIEDLREVSHQWNQNVVANGATLPAIPMGKLRFSNFMAELHWNIRPIGCCKHAENNRQKLEDLSDYILKSIVVENVKFFMYESEKASLEEILEKKHRKIKSKEACFVLSYFKNGVFEKHIKAYEYILSNLIDAETIRLKFINITSREALDYLSTLTLPSSLCTIDLTKTSAGIMPSEFKNFVFTRTPSHQLYINPSTFSHELGIQVLEHFITTRAPEMMVRWIKIKGVAKPLVRELNKLLQTFVHHPRKFVRKLDPGLPIDHIKVFCTRACFRNIFVFQRKDGWNLDIAVPRPTCIENMYEILYNIEKNVIYDV